jgi:hypothetical protein
VLELVCCFSLRTLCRALSVAALNKCGSVPRSLHEAFCLSFLTQLDYSSHPVVEQMVAKWVVFRVWSGISNGILFSHEIMFTGLVFYLIWLLILCILCFLHFRAVTGSTDVRSILKQPIPPPSSTDPDQYVCFEGYWVPRGSLEPTIDAKVKQIFVVLVRYMCHTWCYISHLIYWIYHFSKRKFANCLSVYKYIHTYIHTYIRAYIHSTDSEVSETDCRMWNKL